MEAHIKVFYVSTCKVRTSWDNVSRHGVVDVKQCCRLFCSTFAHILRYSTVEVHLASYRNATTCEAWVYVARLKFEYRLPSRPALVCEYCIVASALVVLIPVEDGKLQLSHLVDDFWVSVAWTELFLHVFCNSGNLCLAGSNLLILTFHVELRVLLYLNAEVIERLDRSVAGKEVERTRTETDDLEVLDADDYAGDVAEVGELLDSFVWVYVRILRNIYLEAAETYAVWEIEHAAKCVTTVRCKVCLALFLCCKNHGWTLELLYEHGRRTFRTKVSEEHADSVDAIVVSPLEGIHGVNFVLDDYRTVINFRESSLTNFIHKSG